MKIERKIETKNFMSRNGYKPEIFVLHLADGFYPCLAQNTSYHYAIGKNGEIAEQVPIDKAAWTQGVLRSPTAKLIIDNYNKNRSYNPNWNCIGIECAGFYNDFYSNKVLKEKGCKGNLPDKQVDGIIEAIQYCNDLIQKQYGYKIPYDRDHIIGHYEINPVTRSSCGKNFPYDYIIDKLNGKEPVKKNDIPVEEDNKTDFKVGDIVILNGKLFASSTDNIQGKVNHNNEMVEIKRIYPNSLHPYYVNNIGYADKSMLSLSKIMVGSKVKIICDKYDTGTPIKEWVKKEIYTVDKIDEKNNRARLKEIFSWVPINGLLIV